MKLGIALIAAALLTASPLLAQTPAGAAQQKPAPVQPGQPAATPPAAASEKLDPAKDAAIRHLLDITGESKEGQNISTGMTNQVHKVMSSSIPPDQMPKFMDTFTAKFNAGAPPNAVTDAMVAIYARHFSMEDIQGITKFYESPVGQQMVKEMPDVSRDAQNVGMQMDQKVAMQVLWGMEDEYPQLKQVLPPDPSKPAPAPAPSAAPAPGPSATPPATPPPSPAPKPQQ
ncbi:MAG TPA: DUF2059 domain-containing protein [Candidatus Acidoferrales bacterium]|jgi:hypothetical protein|nr:DUF2059 domain-containing protein [Candidatus Acidoferrales bacterium]